MKRSVLTVTTQRSDSPTSWARFYPCILSACFCLIACQAALQLTSHVISRPHLAFSTDIYYTRAVYRTHVLLLSAFVIGWLLHPLASALSKQRGLWFDTSPSTVRIIGLVVAASVSAWLVMLFGRHQFGGFDHNILLEIGWRQHLGQRPYIDFPTSTPPFFNLGIALAFGMFGVSWKSMLVFTALFTAGTLVWLDYLLRRCGVDPFVSLFTAFTIEVVSMVSCAFWWYNNTTLVLTAILFLSTFALGRHPRSIGISLSFILSFALTALTKPNIAGIGLIGCAILLCASLDSFVRSVLHLVFGVLSAFLILLVTHVPVGAMVNSYLGVARERGATSAFGFGEQSVGDRPLAIVWFILLSLPVLACIKPLTTSLQQSRFREAAPSLFPFLAVLIAVFGLLGNGELRDVEVTVLIAALALIAYILIPQNVWLQRYVVALLCALCASNLYIGGSRTRVYTIGAHKFFEWQDNDQVISEGPLSGMHVSQTFIDTNKEIAEAVSHNPKPLFLGPRVDYSYMLLGLPSPVHFPAWWHPGTAFDRSRMPEIIRHWEAQRFPTLVFLKDDFTLYPTELTDYINKSYRRDDHFQHVTIFHLR